MYKAISTDILAQYRRPNEKALDQLLQAEIEKSGAKIVVLDDDPTGTQTVHDVFVYTDWKAEHLRDGFLRPQRVMYILTNSRGVSSAETESIHREIAAQLVQVSDETRTPFLLVSRSDSTLRGHYPLETETLRQTLSVHGIDFNGEILCFFFKEGGRYTIDNVHYVQNGEELIPVGLTEFSRDKTFGYSASNLCNYVEEKTHGMTRAADVITIDLKSLRVPDIDRIEQQLLAAEGFSKIIVNAIDYSDLKVFCIALYRAIAKGKCFLYRTAASFIKTLGGMRERPLLSGEELMENSNRNGGLVIVGSHVDKTSRQLNYLRNSTPAMRFLEFDQHNIWKPNGLLKESERILKLVEQAIAEGTSVTVYTRRERVDLPIDDPEAQLKISTDISAALTDIVKKMRIKPSFLIAKGGITSYDIGVNGLGVRCAKVIGQIAPGIPVWRTGRESKFCGLLYIIFPGNVGEDYTLGEIVNCLLGQSHAEKGDWNGQM